MQKMFVIHYYINKQILDSYLHTKCEKIWLLFTFVLNWVFLRFPWQWQTFWNFQASKPFIHMPYNISIKLHPSTLNFSHFFVATPVILKFLSLKIMCTHVRQNFWKFSSNSEHHSKPTMNINSQHHNLLGNQISPKLEDFCIWRPFYTLVTMVTATVLNFFNPPKAATYYGGSSYKVDHNISQTMDINSQHQNLLGNQISPKSENFCILVAILD